MPRGLVKVDRLICVAVLYLFESILVTHGAISVVRIAIHEISRPGTIVAGKSELLLYLLQALPLDKTVLEIHFSVLGLGAHLSATTLMDQFLKLLDVGILHLSLVLYTCRYGVNMKGVVLSYES